MERLRALYPKGERGRPPIGLERMLRIHFLQQWYGLADEAVEEPPRLLRIDLVHVDRADVLEGVPNRPLSARPTVDRNACGRAMCSSVCRHSTTSAGKSAC